MAVNTRSRVTSSAATDTMFERDDLENQDMVRPHKLRATTNASSRRRRPRRPHDNVFDQDELESPKRTPPKSTPTMNETNRKPPPVFEEDVLASTSEESEVDEDELREAAAEVDMEDEEDNVQRPNDMDWSPTDCGDGGGEEYKMFLRSILGEGEGDVQNGFGDVSEEALAALLDGEGDNDFDYLQAVATAPDDPYEYRDDRGVHVSSREVVQLVQQHDATLRPRTRRVNSQPTVQRPAIPATPRVLPVPITALNGQQVLQQPQQSSPLFTVTQVSMLQDQYAQHIHLLAAIHADASKVAATTPSQRQTSALPERSTENAKEALSITSSVIKSLQDTRNTALAFWNMIAPARDSHARALAGGAPFSCPSLQEPSTVAPVASLFDSPAIRHLDQFVAHCENADWNTVAPLDVVQRLQPHLHPLLLERLAPRPLRTSRNSSNELHSLPDWTKADDALLLMTLNKHTRAFGDNYADLLPHRSEQNCLQRVKTLASRRVSDNPIKRFVLDNATPLSRADIAKLQEIFQRYGPGAQQNPEVWKSVQREIFPTREIAMLEKLWETRERRRKYKSDYRQKLKSENEQRKRESGASKSLQKSRVNGKRSASPPKRPRPPKKSANATPTGRIPRPPVPSIVQHVVPVPLMQRVMPARSSALPFANMTRPIAPTPTATAIIPPPVAPAISIANSGATPILPAPVHVAPAIPSGNPVHTSRTAPILPAPVQPVIIPANPGVPMVLQGHGTLTVQGPTPAILPTAPLLTRISPVSCATSTRPETNSAVTKVAPGKEQKRSTAQVNTSRVQENARRVGARVRAGAKTGTRSSKAALPDIMHRVGGLHSASVPRARSADEKSN